MIDLFDELTAIVRALDGERIPYAIVGGLAYSVWVETRATEDIDLLIMPEDLGRAEEAVRPLGYLRIADASDSRFLRLTKLYRDEALVLDLFLADTSVLADGIRDSSVLEFEGQTYSVASPAIIISMKEARMRGQDRNDIERLKELVEVNGE
jgi:hypothetical protein